jgi:hypothetical protein
MALLETRETVPIVEGRDITTNVDTIKKNNENLESKLQNCRSLLEQMRESIDNEPVAAESRGDARCSKMQRRASGSSERDMTDVFDINESKGKLAKSIENNRKNKSPKQKALEMTRQQSIDSFDESLILQNEVVIANPHVSSHDEIEFARANRRPRVLKPEFAELFQVDKEFIRKKYHMSYDEDESDMEDTATHDETYDGCTYEEEEDEETLSSATSRRKSDWVTRPVSPTPPSCFTCCMGDEN